MYHVYIIQSLKTPNQYYTGFTEKIKNRIIDHNKGKSPHTNKFKPWKLVFYCSFEDKTKALNFETYLKSSSGRALRNKRLI